MGNILLFTDLHLHHSWYDRGNAFLEWLSDVINKNNVTKIIHLGDVFEESDRVSNIVKTQLVEFLIKHEDKEFLWLVGNHDARIEHYTTIEFLRGLDNHSLIKEKTYLKIGNKDCLFLPYTYDLSNDSADVLFFHNEIKNFKLPNGFVFTTGLDIEKLTNFKVCYGGHIHNRVSFKYEESEINYLGSPFYRDFRDAEVNSLKIKYRGVCLFDENLEKRKFIPFVYDVYLRYRNVKVKKFSKIKDFVLKLSEKVNVFCWIDINEAIPSSEWKEVSEIPSIKLFLVTLNSNSEEEKDDVSSIGTISNDIKDVILDLVKDESLLDFGRGIFKKWGINL